MDATKGLAVAGLLLLILGPLWPRKETAVVASSGLTEDVRSRIIGWGFM